CVIFFLVFFFFSSRRRHTRSKRDWSSDVCSSDLLAETALDYLSFRDAEAIVVQHPSNPVGHIMDRLAEHQLATRFWNTVFLASSAVLITVFIDHFVNNVWLAAAGGIAVMAGLTLVISARSPRRIGAQC